MKVKREFSPIIITIETPEEAEMFYCIMRASVYNSYKSEHKEKLPFSVDDVIHFKNDMTQMLEEERR